ncbi:MAG: hypothetical protein AB8G22_15705 [Saprospiraceae bacterium]
MYNHTLTRYLKKCSTADLRELAKWVRSPVFNQREDVIQLYDYLHKNLHRPSPRLLDKEVVFSSVFVNEKYDGKKLRYTTSFLLKCIKQYFSYQRYIADNFRQQLDLCYALRERGLDKYFAKEWNEVERIQQKNPLRNAHFHYQNYQLQEEQYHQITQQRRSKAMDFAPLTNELTTFFIADLLRQSCNILTHNIQTQQAVSIQLLAEVLQHVEQHDYSNAPAVLIYYHSYSALKNLDEEHHFEQLKKYIHDYQNAFPAAEMKYIYLLAINYCIKRVNNGVRRYLEEGLNLYQAGLQSKILLENGVLANFTYHNVLRLGLALKRYAWCNEFLHHYQQFLAAADRDNTFRYNLAFLYFEQTEYENAMHELRRVEFKNVFNNLDARRLLLRSYFEMGEYQALESLLDSSKTYISRQRGLGYHKNNYLNLVRFTKKLLNLNGKDKSGKEKLRKEIEATPRVAERNWLLSKL